MYLKKISRRRKCKVENRTVLIKNIPWVVKDEAIEILCEQFGKVQSVFKRENVYEEYSRSLCVSFYEAETASRLLHLGQLKYLYTMLKVCTAHKKYQPVRLANGDLIFYNQEIMKKDANMLHVKPKKESQQNASPLSVSDSNSSSNFQAESENTVNVESNLVDQNSNYTVQKYSRTSKTCNSSRSTRRPSLRLSNLGLEYQYFYGNKKHRKESRAHDRQRMSKFFNYRENIEICFDDDRCSKEERKSEMYFSKLLGIMQYPEQFLHWEKRDIYQKTISGNTSSTPPDNHKITFKNKTSEKSLNLEHKNIFTVDNGWYAKDENVRERIATIILSLIEEDKITVEHQEQLSRDSEGSIHPRTISTSSSSRIDDDHISLENIASPKSMNLEPINVFFDESNQNTEDDTEENMSLMLSAFLGQDEISLEYALKYSKILSVFKEQERCVGRKIRWKGFQPIWSTPSQENYDISPNGYFDKLQPIAPCIQDEIDVTWNAVLRLNKLLFELDVKLKTKEYDEFNSSQSQEIIQHPMKQLIENNMSCPIWPAFVFPVTPSVNASNFLSPLYFNSSCDSSSYIQNDFSQDSFTRILQIGSRDLSLPTEDTRDLIWTKDNILVRSVYVSNVKPIVTIQDLRNVFEPFGAIYEVVILQTAHPDKRVTYNAIVTFLDAESATNLLRCKFPQICYGKRLYVKQALSVNQPVDLLNGKILYNQDDIFNYNLKNYYYLNGYTNNSHLMINNRNMKPANQSHSTDSYYENSYEYNYTPNNMDNSTWRNMYYPTTSVLNNAVPWNQQFHEPIINQISETILEKLKTLNQCYQKAPYPQLYPQERYQQENDSMTINTIFEQEAIRRSNFFQSSPKSDVDANYLSRYYKAFGEHDRSESTIN